MMSSSNATPRLSFPLSRWVMISPFAVVLATMTAWPSSVSMRLPSTLGVVGDLMSCGWIHDLYACSSVRASRAVRECLKRSSPRICDNSPTRL